MHRMDELKKLFTRKREEGGDFEGMWSAVTPGDGDCPAPSARSKHSATLLTGNVYLFGGRNGNVPLKDFWKYNLAEGKWQQIQPNGDRPPCLQEHTAVAYKDCMYVFGGEVGFSAGTETPLWVYDVKYNTWRKIRSRKGVSVPRGRRGHTALVHRGTMLVYGGYQDLRGSCSELWAFHFETESWHLISNSTNGKNMNDMMPPPRHKHSAVLHEDSMWVYGGMTDLQDRSDLWRWDTVSKAWNTYKLKNTPGPLHSHAACRLPSSMVLFGGEKEGHPTNEVWKFHFDTECWEKILVNGVKPQPRAECVAFAVSELLLKETAGASLESRMARTRSRTASSSGEKSFRHPTYLPHNRVSPYEKTYVFKPSQGNYTDGSDVLHHHPETDRASSNFLREISKLSQINLSRLSHNKCSYTVLTTGNNDSTESLLRQQSSVQDTDSESATPTRMVKSRSAYAIKKKYVIEQQPSDVEETDIDSTTMRNTKLNSEIGKKMTREPISVPNFTTLILPTPTLTPVEAARLVYLDSDDEFDDDNINPIYKCEKQIIQVKPSTSPRECILYENFKSVKRGESYNSHLGYADNPLYQHMLSANSVKFEKCTEAEENISTSDYASLETMNRMSSSSSYSTSRQQTPQEENSNTTHFRAKGKSFHQVNSGPFGFCNPNYMGPDIQLLLSSGKTNWKYSDTENKKQYAKLLNTPDSVLEDTLGRSTSRHMGFEENLEMQNMVNNELIRTPVKTLKRSGKKIPPKSLELDSPPSTVKIRVDKCRASSASRVERHTVRRAIAKEEEEDDHNPTPDVFVPLYVFIIGGKEQGQVTVFKRPISIWKLKLF